MSDSFSMPTHASSCRSKLLLLGTDLSYSEAGGRELLSMLYRDCLKYLLGSRLVLSQLSPNKTKNLIARAASLLGYIDGLSFHAVEDVLHTIQRGEIQQVIIDGSNLGIFAKKLKHSRPSTEVITIFHNVETKFFWDAFRINPTAHSLGVLLANARAERNAVNYSNKIICLSERDSHLLNKLYGRRATQISPIALKDTCPVEYMLPAPLEPKRFSLFVGGSFYANRQGMEWFVREVSPRTEVPLFIIGHGFEALRNQLERPGKVIVVGSVDNLADWYRRAQFVIAPIFHGSGMKTKVAEALMHGKKVIGTPEAFSGYEQVAARAGWCCSSPTEFVSAINEARASITSSFDPELRALYEEHYSVTAATTRLAEALGENRDF